MEANNDAGLAAHPLARCAMSCVYSRLAMLAYTARMIHPD